MRWAAFLALAVVGAAPAASQSGSGGAGWTEVEDSDQTRIFGRRHYLRTGPFITDVRLDDPARTLDACRRYGAEPERLGRTILKWGCAFFLYPANSALPQAAEARAIYEQDFARASTQAERIARAIQSRHLADIELLAGANAETLNTFVEWNGAAITVAELYTRFNEGSPDKVQWLYDNGARLCEGEGPPSVRRYSCQELYAINDMKWPKHDATLDVLERNGYRPRNSVDVAAALQSAELVPAANLPSRDRFAALLAPADRARYEELRAATVARGAARQEAEARARGEASATPEENLAAAARLAEPGTPVCRALTVNDATYRFAATVEGASRTRLQLRAGSIRAGGDELTNLPYRDTRITPGVVFWDDAGLWTECE